MSDENNENNKSDENSENNQLKDLSSDIDVSTDGGLSQVDDIFNSSIPNISPLLMIIIVVVLVMYFVLFGYLGKSQNDMGENGGGISSLEIILWGLFVFLLLINGIQYFFNIDV